MISIQMSTLVFVIYSLAICIIPSKSFQSVLFVKNVILNRHISSSRQSKQILYGENNMNKRDKNFDKIFDQIDFKRDQINDLPPMEQDPLYSVIKSIVVAGSSRKATGIIALRVTHLTEVARFMVVLEGTSRPQTQAIANAVEVYFVISISIYRYNYIQGTLYN